MVPFETCQLPGRCQPEAHGWAMVIEFCFRARCTAERRTNFNGDVQERGPWTPGLTGRQATLRISS